MPRSRSESPSTWGDLLALLAVAALIVAVGMVGGCSTVSDAHMAADRSVYAHEAPLARAGGMDADGDLAWRVAAGVTSTACPGGVDDPALVHGLYPVVAK